MNKRLQQLKALCLLVLLSVSTTLLSQDNSRLPTKQELDTKLALEKIYKSNAARNIGAPNHLMVTGPEQNCNNALPVCAQSYTQTSSYTGYGVQELSTTCLTSDETNSVWYTFTVQNSGTFTFMLNTANDYDFALYDITTIGCAGVPSATPIRCNYSATYGSTGLTLPPGSSAPNGIGAGGAPTMPGITVTAGQTFALIIDNYSANSNGYTLTFGGSAQIFDQTAPTITSMTAPCNVGTITLTLSEPIRCNSIAANGSDFSIAGPSGNVTVLSAAGNCSGGAGFTNQLTVTYDNTAMPTGTYTLTTATGGDGNTILDNCGNTMATGLSQTFEHLGPLTITASDAAVCAGGATTISVSGGTDAATYSWAPVAGTNDSITVTPNVTTNYNVTVNYNGCIGSATQAITITNPPIVSVNPANASLCSGTTNVAASASINGSICTNCDFTWTGGATQTDLNTATSTLTGVGAGTYSVQVTSSTGCIGNIAVANVNIATPSALPSCNIIYVSPAGGGDGITKATPTDIVTAIGMAQCNSTVIKMQIGDYVINTPLNIGSLITIEGGYNVGFTKKTSAKATSGGFPAQGTRIRRTTTAPEGIAGNERLTAVNVTGGSAFFRLQDLIISVDNPAAGTKISNYAVYLGSGCSDYNIVRCLIDAGTGAPGGAGANGVNGVNGGNGGNGNQVPWGGSSYGDGGTSAVAGQVGGSGGVGNDASTMIYLDVNGNGTYQAGTDVRTNTADYYGENGYGGGANSLSNPNAGGAGGQVWGSESNLGGCDNPGLPYDGANGVAGVDGINGTNGVNGSPSGFAGGYFVAGGNGTSGTSGTDGTRGTGAGGGGYQDVAFDGYGGGGGGGGGAGQGGTGGAGATAGGSAFGIFSVSKGGNTNVIDCSIAAVAGAGGSGGTASTGGTGGTGGTGVVNDCDAGGGGNGGAAGRGGNGGAGGNADPGQACFVCDLTGTTLNIIPYSSVALANQAVITADNIACVNTDIDFEASSGNPNWTNFGANSTPAAGAGTPFNDVEYSAIGYETVTLNSDVTNVVPAVLVGAAQTVSNTATSPALGTTACPTPTNNNIVVAGYPASTSMNASGITVRISNSNHTWRSDVSMFLVAPSGQILGLADNRGNGGACTLTNINFSDAGATAMGGTCPAAGSTFRPEAATYTDCGVTSTITTFGALGGAINPNGTWTLRMVDNVNIDGGAAIAVGGWSINFPTYSYTGTSSVTANQNDTYTDFLNIQTTQPSAGNILASATQICPDTALFSSTVAGSPGFTYNWSVTPSTGVTVLTGTTSATAISFPNATASPITYTVSLQVSTECCGALTPITQTITVNPIPATPTVANEAICTGGAAVFTVTAPVGESFDWYTSATGGSSINTGTTYSVNPVNANQTYYVQSINSGGCQSTRVPVSVNVTPVNAPTAVDAIICEPGTVQVGVTAVPGSTVYNWYSDAAGTTLLQTGSSLTYGVDVLTAGTSVTVYVSDSIPGCNESALIPVVATVSNNPIIADTTYSPSSMVCPGTNVTITVSASGGNGAFTYLWMPNGETVDNIVIPSATNSTSYSVLISDGTCSKMISAPLIVGSGGTPPTITGLNALCEGDSIVLVTPEVIGATYSWTGPGGPGISVNDTLVITPASAASSGNYSVFVDDGSGCANPSAAYNVNVNTLPAVSVSGLAPICNGGTLTLTAGSTADTYTWSAGATPTSATTADVSPTTPTTYTLTGTTTATGCSDTAVFTVNVNALPTVASTPVSVCVGNPATVVVTGTDTYVWSTTETNDTIIVTPSVVGVTTYTVTGTDATTTCTNSVTVDVTATDLPVIAATAASPTLCDGDSTTLTATGGTTYSWSSGSVIDTETVTPGVGPTSYTVTGTTAGCSNTATVTVTVNALPAVSVSGVAPICSGSTLTLTAGSTADTYAWSAGATPTSATTAGVSPTTPTTYTLTGTITATGCTDTAVFTVNVNALPPVAATPTAVCVGSPVTVTATGADTYVWSTTATTNTITVTPAVSGVTTYTVIGTDATTTCTNSVTVDVTATDLPVVTVSASSPSICSGGSTTLTAGGGTTYTWSNDPTTNSSQSVSPLTPTTYTVTGTTGGCSNTATVTVNVNQAPAVAGAATNATCNLNNGAVNVIVANGSPAFIYNWVSVPSNTPVGSTEDLTGVGIGSYQLTITDANLCTVTSPVYTVADGGSVIASFTTDVTSGTAPLVVTINNNTTGATSNGWNFGNGQTSGVVNPTPVTYSVSGVYTITLVASNGTCFDTVTVVVTAETPIPPSSITIPNIFSPNNDGLNDQFTIYSTGLKTLSVDIFNRWGQKVSMIDGIGQSWDGKLQNGNQASEGTYFYMLKAVGFDGVEYSKEGSMMLVE